MNVEIGDSFLPLADGSLDDQGFILIEGPRGTAKTRSILTVLLCRALRYPGVKILLARSTRTLLGKTVLATLEEQVFPAFGMQVPGGKIDRGNRREYRLPNGSVFIPEGLDDISRSQSAEYRYIYAAEVGEIPDQNTIVALAGSMRQDVPGASPPQCICDVNPGPPKHWANTLAQDADDTLRAVETREDYQRLLDFNRSNLPSKGRWKRIITCHKDNPGYWDHEKWDWTSLGRQYVTTTLDCLTGFLRQRWLYGLWVAAEGSIFPMFSTKRHVVQPFDIGDWPVNMGWDPGASHPTGIMWCATAPNGCIYIFDEIYQGGRDVPGHCDEIKSKELSRRLAGQPLNIQRRYGDPQYAFSSTAHSIITIAQQAAACGIELEPWPRTINNANELQMIEAMQSLLNQGKIKVFANCQNTINEFQSWSWKKNADGSQKDEPEDRCNDLLDPLKGMVAAGIHDTSCRVTVTGGDKPVTVTEPERPNDGEAMQMRRSSGGV